MRGLRHLLARHGHRDFDQVSGIATTRVRAFTPEDALLVGDTLVSLSEELVDKIAEPHTGRRRQVRAGRGHQGRDRLEQNRRAIAAYRDRAGLIDPDTSVVASFRDPDPDFAGDPGAAGGSACDLYAAEPATDRSGGGGVEAPDPIHPRAAQACRGQRREEFRRTAAFDRDRRIRTARPGEATRADAADRRGASAGTGARQRRRADLYVTPYVRPSLPTSSTYPQRLRSVLYVAGVAFVFSLIALMIVRSVRERYA